PVWWAVRGETRLAGAARPGPECDFHDLRAESGLDAIVSLTDDNSYDCSPLRRTIILLEDLYARSGPTDPASELGLVQQAVTTVRELLDRRLGVLVHCAGGTGRTGTVIGAVLVSYGIEAPTVAAWLDEVHRLRGNSGWPESPWQRDVLHRFTPAPDQSSPDAPPGTSR
ncbi:MAG: hypothetical protein DRJ50_11910, partial [Actinobacteria bacterium]